MEESVKSKLQSSPPSSTIISRNDLSKSMLKKIGQLSFRVARTLCRPLRIQQKTKGVHKNLSEIKVAIKQKLEHHREQTIALIQSRQP